MIDAKWRKPAISRSSAMKNMPAVANVSALQVFLGLTHYYGDFIPNIHILRAPQNKLLKKILNETGVPNVRVLLRK